MELGRHAQFARGKDEHAGEAQGVLLLPRGALLLYTGDLLAHCIYYHQVNEFGVMVG